MGRGQTARSAAAVAAGAASSVSVRPSVARQPTAQQPLSSQPAAKQPAMLNFGASLQQAAVSHLGMSLFFPAPPCPGASRGMNLGAPDSSHA
jgi:hypothetical protein